MHMASKKKRKKKEVVYHTKQSYKNCPQPHVHTNTALSWFYSVIRNTLYSNIIF